MESSFSIALLATTILCGSAIPATSEGEPESQRLYADTSASDSKAQSVAARKSHTSSANKSGEPAPPHEQLAIHFVGTWKVEQTFWSKGAAPITEIGTEVGELALARRHVISTLIGQFGGQSFTGISIISYDNEKQKYLSTWVDSLSTSQFRCEGDYNRQDTTYTFRCGMSDPKNPQGVIPVRGVIQIEDDQSHIVEWYVSPDGTERLSNRSVYTRVSR